MKNPRKNGNVKSVEKKVNEVNRLIALAVDTEGDPIGVIDTSGTWLAEMYFKPFKYANGVLYTEFSQQGEREVTKHKTLKKHMELDGIPYLNDVAKMYRKALKKHNINF